MSLRRTLAVLCLVVAGSACGGGGDGERAAAASSAFCDKAVEFEQSAAAATGISSPDEMQAAVDRLTDIAAEAPHQMADEFEALIGVLQRLVTAMRSVGDGDAAATVEALQTVLTPAAAAQVEDASRDVEAILALECGIVDQAAHDEDAGAATAPPTSTPPGDPAALGTDRALAPLAVACHDGDMAKCDELYLASPAGSPYEAYGDTCGMRTTVDAFCVDTYPPTTADRR